MNANLARANLDKASFVGTDLSPANLTGADLRDADLSHANLQNSNLTGADLTGADLTDASLGDATLTNASLTGVKWSRTQCPDYSSSNADGGSCVGHEAVPVGPMGDNLLPFAPRNVCYLSQSTALWRPWTTTARRSVPTLMPFRRLPDLGSPATSWSPRRSCRSRRSGPGARRPPSTSVVFLTSPAFLVAFQNSSCSCGILLQVLGLEVVGPQHPQVVLDQLGPLLLDHDGPGLEGLVVGGVVLLDGALDRLGLDAGLSRVVDAAGQVAVGVHHLGADTRSTVASRWSAMRMAVLLFGILVLGGHRCCVLRSLRYRPSGAEWVMVPHRAHLTQVRGRRTWRLGHPDRTPGGELGHRWARRLVVWPPPSGGGLVRARSGGSRWSGHSMAPALLPGDRLVVVGRPWRPALARRPARWWRSGIRGGPTAS